MRSDGRFAAKPLLQWLGSAVVLVAAMGSGPDRVHGQSADAATGKAVDKPLDKGIEATDLRGEWLRAGPGFACKVAAPAKLRPDQIKPDILARACLHMGPFAIGDDAQALMTTLGAPHRTRPQPNGAMASIYFLEKENQFPYLVATVSKNRIIALQVTGPVAAKDYGFNHVDLGVTTDTLVQFFGQPNHLEPSEEKDTELWGYRPWPFSFEVRSGHVTSIRINEAN